MDLSTHIGHICAEGQVNGSSQSEPSSLHPKGHEAGTQHRSSQVYVQVRHLDVWLPKKVRKRQLFKRMDISYI